jgi:hypothetical protein
MILNIRSISYGIEILISIFLILGVILFQYSHPCLLKKLKVRFVCVIELLAIIECIISV